MIGVVALWGWFILPGEPIYQGKALHLWLAEFDLSSAERPEKASAALRALGTNALPLLYQMIRIKDPLWKKAFFSLNERQLLLRLEPTEARVVRYRAIEGYRVLGAAAKASVPWLIECLSSEPDPAVRADVAAALGWIGPEARAAIPALLKATNDPDPDLRRSALFALANIERWAPERAVEW